MPEILILTPLHTASKESKKIQMELEDSKWKTHNTLSELDAYQKHRKHTLWLDTAVDQFP